MRAVGLGNAFQVLRRAGEPVLRAEQPHELAGVRVGEQCRRRNEVRVHRRRVRDQPDPLAAQRGEIGVPQFVQTGGGVQNGVHAVMILAAFVEAGKRLESLHDSGFGATIAG